MKTVIVKNASSRVIVFRDPGKPDTPANPGDTLVGPVPFELVLPAGVSVRGESCDLAEVRLVVTDN